MSFLSNKSPELNLKLLLEKSSNNLTIKQRMLSAGSGSVLTSLVLTPFDVVRIRIQQQGILPDETPCCNEHMEQKIAQSAKNGTKQSATNLTKQATTNLSSQSTHPNNLQSIHPSSQLFWIDKNYCKTAKECTRINSTWQGFVTIGRNEGVGTLWRGLALTLFMAIPSNVIYFTGYEYIRDRSPLQGSLVNSLFCGSIARLLAATSIAPLELIKTRLQSIPSSRSNPKIFSLVVQDLINMVKQRGLTTLFTGLQITLWRDVPFSGIYWLLYELSKAEFTHLLKADFNSRATKDSTSLANNDWRVFSTSFLSGSLAGTVAAILTHPFDVGKTRMQIGAPANGTKPSMFNSLYSIWANEGTLALYSGLGPRVLKVAPACAIMISSYEISKKLFKNGNEIN